MNIDSMHSNDQRPLRTIVLRTAILTICLSGIASAYSYFRLGSPWAVYNLAAGRVLVVTPRNQSLSVTPGAQVVKVPFAVTNVSFGDITIIGASSSCGCAVVQDLPLTLTSGQSVDLSFAVSLNLSPELLSVTESAQLILDKPSAPVSLEAQFNLDQSKVNSIQ